MAETHVWYDDVAKVWHVYSERRCDIDRFEKWLGAPSRRGREDACAHWNDIPKDALRIARRRMGRPLSPAAREAARRALSRSRDHGE